MSASGEAPGRHNDAFHYYEAKEVRANELRAKIKQAIEDNVPEEALRVLRRALEAVEYVGD